MNNKDWIQYGSAIAMITSGIILAFLSFFKNDGDIGQGVLWYVAQALTYAGSVFGVSVYFRTKLGDLRSNLNKENLLSRENEDKKETDEHAANH